METRILSIDPSGTGTTALFFKGEDWEQFCSHQGSEWKKHYEFIAGMVKVYHPDLLLYEHTNFISLKGKDMTSLLKLLGTMETLTLACSVASPRIEAIPVDQVKRLRAKLLKGEQNIAELKYKPGKGWYCRGKKISVHCLDAYLVYWIWESKANNQLKSKPIGKSIAGSKSKPKTKQNRKEKIIELEPEDIDWPEEPEGCGCEDGCPSCRGHVDIDKEIDHD